MNSKEWKIPYSAPVIPRSLLQAGYTPLLSAVLHLRGVDTPEAARSLLSTDLSILHDPLLMKDMQKARDRLLRAIEAKEKIAVYGDYDVDGITSTCLLYDYIKSKGVRCVPYIPDRMEEGYGLNSPAIESLHAQGVTLIITVDCGITAAEEAKYASELGVDMIITDHHECKSGALPVACAVVDPKQDDDSYPCKYLAGVGVAFKLACACEGDTKAILEAYSDLAAIGTIADVMPLVDENRYIVQRGLELLSASPRPGLRAMLDKCGIADKKASAATVGFTLAPRLNAAGRLGHASLAGRLLMSEDEHEAALIAQELCDLNRERQSIETQIYSEANSMLSGKTPTAPIVLASENWHQGVIGIAASRLAEQYSLPAVMVCLNGDLGKGSCRSYGGFNLFEALSACRDELIDFGGHALAAGLNIKAGKLDDFRRALSLYYEENKPESIPEVQCELTVSDPQLLSLENVDSLSMLEPFGNANPDPMLCILGSRVVRATDVGGGKHLKMRLHFRGRELDAIFFSHSCASLGVREGDLVDLAFTAQINEFNGNRSVQLLVHKLRHHQSGELCKRILDGDTAVLPLCADQCPDRADFIRVWRMFSDGNHALGTTAEDIMLQCPEDMEKERFCVCLATFAEVGLLKSADGGIYGAVRTDIDGKADLEGSATMRALRQRL